MKKSLLNIQIKYYIWCSLYYVATFISKKMSIYKINALLKYTDKFVSKEQNFMEVLFIESSTKINPTLKQD